MTLVQLAPQAQQVQLPIPARLVQLGPADQQDQVVRVAQLLARQVRRVLPEAQALPDQAVDRRGPLVPLDPQATQDQQAAEETQVPQVRLGLQDQLG